MDNCLHWFYLCLAILGVFALLFIMLLRYNLKLKDKTIKLEAQDQEHIRKHQENYLKICRLEAKNGNEQKQIDQLQRKVIELETIINQNKTKKPLKIPLWQ